MIGSFIHNSLNYISEIQIEIWPEPELVGFPKNGRIPDLLQPEPEPKSGTSLSTCSLQATAKTAVTKKNINGVKPT